MGALHPFQPIARLIVDPRRAGILAACIQPDAGCLQRFKGVIGQGRDKGQTPAAAGARQCKAAQFDPARGMADLAKQGKACGLAVFLPDLQPRAGVSQIERQRRLVFIGDEGGVGGMACKTPDKAEVVRRGGARRPPGQSRCRPP